MSRRPGASHALMLPPVGYKFIPKSDRVCGAPGCFECYDIYCQRCESKDRRIMELEMRNNDLCKNLTLLQGQLFAKLQQQHPPNNNDGSRQTSFFEGLSSQPTFRPGGPPSSSMKDAFAYVQSPVLHDPVSNRNYVATTTYTSP
ncbi:hypothetical protein FOL47_009716 [Perkinsus chesapeaki]|uniref:Uncharacterized protein n=1 Tax=Perkinsus chesapeaki TaxID=330153 RepID=A0A7J6L6M7_PERCH|nr:hypothetical protein FOL47_009716 [Perkinsus chesapeaki]